MKMMGVLLGNKTAERVLLYIVNYGEGHISGIAQTFAIPKSQVRKQILRLENGGLLVGRNVGNLRMFSLNPRNPLKREIEALANKALNLMTSEETKRFYRERRRPRRTGKRL